MIQLGGAFGLAFTTIINTTYHARSLASGVPAVDAQLNGLHAAFWLGAAFAGLALGLAVVMLRGMGTVGKGRKVKAVRSAVSAEAESESDDGREQGVGQGEVRGEEEVKRGVGDVRGEKAV